MSCLYYIEQGKEVATSIAKLPEGTVVFEDVSTEKKRGKIAKVTFKVTDMCEIYQSGFQESPGLKLH